MERKLVTILFGFGALQAGAEATAIRKLLA